MSLDGKAKLPVDVLRFLSWWVLVSRKRIEILSEGEFKDGAAIKQVVEILTVLPYLPLCRNALLHNCTPRPRNFKDSEEEIRLWSGVIWEDQRCPFWV